MSNHALSLYVKHHGASSLQTACICGTMSHATMDKNLRHEAGRELARSQHVDSQGTCVRTEAKLQGKA